MGRPIRSPTLPRFGNGQPRCLVLRNRRSVRGSSGSVPDESLGLLAHPPRYRGGLPRGRNRSPAAGGRRRGNHDPWGPGRGVHPGRHDACVVGVERITAPDVLRLEGLTRAALGKWPNRANTWRSFRCFSTLVRGAEGSRSGSVTRAHRSPGGGPVHLETSALGPNYAAHGTTAPRTVKGSNPV